MTPTDRHGAGSCGPQSAPPGSADTLALAELRLGISAHAFNDPADTRLLAAYLRLVRSLVGAHLVALAPEAPCPGCAGRVTAGACPVRAEFHDVVGVLLAEGEAPRPDPPIPGRRFPARRDRPPRARPAARAAFDPSHPRGHPR